MGKMFFYDIMMLYKRYEEYVKEENEQQEAQQKEYESRYDDMKYDHSNMASQISKNVGNITPSSLTSGFTFPK